MKTYQRTIEPKIEEKLFKGKVVIIYGPRQTGKTTLVKKLAQKYDGAYFSCEEPDVQSALTHATSTAMKQFLGNHKLVVLDEAQTISDIGTALKLLVDNYPDMQIIATGSSSFELANKINEPLTGRNWEFHLYPLSIAEMAHNYSILETNRLLDQLLVYGAYPEIVSASEFRVDALAKITNDYLYKDILSFGGVRKPDVLKKVVRALALQVGSQVSYSEIANIAGTSRETVANYIDILEKAFIIFKLPPLTVRARDEIKLMNKIYFYDNGILNTLRQNYQSPENRNDVGALFENFFVSEMIKDRVYAGAMTRLYFWRTKDGQEVDIVEEFQSGQEYHAYECKYREIRARISKKFLDTYPVTKTTTIHKNNIVALFMK